MASDIPKLSEEGVKECPRCRRKLEESEKLKVFYGKEYWDRDVGMTGSTTMRVCGKCFEELSGEGLRCIKDKNGDWVYPEEIEEKEKNKTNAITEFPKLSEEEIKELRYLLADWEDDNISDYEYCNKVGDILGLGKWTCKGLGE